MPNFASIADKKLADVVKAPLPPAGHYKFIVTKHPEQTKRGIYEVVEFACKAVAPATDVDPEQLAKYGDVSKILLRKGFLFNTEDAVAFQQTENNLKRFLIDHLKCMDENGSFKQGFAASINCPFLCEVKWTPDKDNEGDFFANMGKTAPIGDEKIKLAA